MVKCVERVEILEVGERKFGSRAPKSDLMVAKQGTGTPSVGKARKVLDRAAL